MRQPNSLIKVFLFLSTFAIKGGPVADAATAAINETDLLLQFFQNTQGSQWVRSDFWGSNTVPLCQWYGITCRSGSSSSTSGVVEISLPRNNVAQKITHLYQLPYLQRLYLPQNPITDAGFQDALYAGSSSSSQQQQVLAQAPSLEIIDLQGCLIQHLVGLTHLLPNLQQLLLSHNRLTIFPTEVLATSGMVTTAPLCCQKLQKLDVSFNQIQGDIPSMIGNALLATSLRELTLTDNLMKGTLPESLGQLTQLEILNLGGSNQQWTGTIPLSLTRLSTLTLVNLERTETISSSSSSIVNNSNNQTTNDRLTGPLPSFSSSPQLQTLLLGNQALTGTIPSDFLAATVVTTTTAATNVVTVHLQNNALVGTIPQSVFSRFDRLTLNIVPGNKFTGTLPSTFCAKSLWMNGNVGQFGCNAIACPVGSFAYNTGRQVDSQTPCYQCSDTASSSTPLFLGATSCDGGSVPLLTQEQILALFYEALSGPRWTKQIGWKNAYAGVLASIAKDVQTVDFTGINVCGFSGILCNSKGQVSILSLPSNGLAGVIPPLLFALTSLVSLDLSNNMIELDVNSGFSVLQSATALKRLNLSRTKVTSLAGIQYGTQLTELSLTGNSLISSLPQELFSLTKLSSLQLEACGILGTLSSSLGQMTNLKTYV